MSWLFSRALVAEYSRGISSDGVVYALPSEMSTQQAFLCNGKTMEFSMLSRYGMTCARLTEKAGEELLTWFLAVFHAKPTAPLLREKIMQMISGRKCDGSWQMSLPGTSLPRTSKDEQSIEQVTTSKRWVTKPAQFPYPRKTWVQTTYGNGIGYLHTPTTQGNYCATSMQKHKSCRAWVTVFGKVTPQAQEWLIGWPIGWTDLKPLEMDKFHAWLLSHCKYLRVNDA